MRFLLLAGVLCFAGPAHAQVGAFAGSYETLLPEKIGGKIPTVRWRMQCTTAECEFAAGENSDKFDAVRPVRASILEQANYALGYAREHKGPALAERPDLKPLLDSRARIAECIDLGKMDSQVQQDGYIVLCKLDGNPWPKPVVLLLGTILANCGPAFCRFEIIPLFKR